MKQKFFVTALCLLAAGLVWAAAKPNFSGTWQLDTTRSTGLQQGMEATMTVKHENDTIELETKTTVPQRPEIVQKDSYRLDGGESEFTPPQPPNAKGKRSVQWMPRGNGILVNEIITAPGPNDTTVTTNITRKWIISQDGKELTVDIYIDDSRGSREIKRIFVKK